MPDFTRGQFPSLDGDNESEVAQRTEPDTDGDWFRKVFTVHNRAHTKGLGADHPHHLTNFVAVLQAALQQGLHPKRAPEFESETDHPTDANSTNLTYRVHVVPAVADLHPETTVTPSSLDAVLANPDALAPIPAPPAPAEPGRWDRGETGEQPVAGPTPPADPSTPPASTESASAQTPPDASSTPSPELDGAPAAPIAEGPSPDPATVQETTPAPAEPGA